jgi:hypothetical protein
VLDTLRPLGEPTFSFAFLVRVPAGKLLQEIFFVLLRDPRLFLSPDALQWWLPQRWLR